MKSFLLVMIGGALGAGLRFGVGRILPLNMSAWPSATFAVNIIGGFLMGMLVGWLARFGNGGEDIRLLLGVGLLGGFTTFSAFSLEMALMIERGQAAQAIVYAALSVGLALTALFAGLFVIRAVTA